MNINSILKKERSPYKWVHLFFWIITWLFAIWIFIYCNGWSIGIPKTAVHTVPAMSGSTMTEFFERFGFVLVDTQSDKIRLQLDDGKEQKTLIQQSAPYGTHTMTLLGEEGEKLTFNFHIDQDQQFIRRNFTLFHPARSIEVSSGGVKDASKIRKASLCMGSGEGYKSQGSECEDMTSVRYGTLDQSGMLTTNIGKTSMYPYMINEVGYISSGNIIIPRGYFGKSEIYSISSITSKSGSIRDIFHHLGGDYILTSSGNIAPLGTSKSLKISSPQNLRQIESIGGDLFTLEDSGRVTFYDELFRSSSIQNIELSFPFKIHNYEHAYILSSASGSYLYQPYQQYGEPLGSGSLINQEGEIMSFLRADNTRQKVILSPINPMK